ncbi:MAG: hypothetical protein WBA88_25885 [Pseudaminobacter sp.]
MTRAPAAPVHARLALFATCVLARLADVLVLRSDEWLGEQVLTRLVGFVLLAVYLRVGNRRLADIGFHGRDWRFAAGLGSGDGVAGRTRLCTGIGCGGTCQGVPVHLDEELVDRLRRPNPPQHDPQPAARLHAGGRSGHDRAARPRSPRWRSPCCPS